MSSNLPAKRPISTSWWTFIIPQSVDCVVNDVSQFLSNPCNPCPKTYFSAFSANLLKTKHGIADTKPIILEALQDHINFSYARFLKFESECKEFEKKYKMDSEFFLNKFDSGELGLL